MNLTKAIVVVDDFVDVQNPSEVAWRVANNINPSQDIVIVEGPLDDLEVGSPTPRFGGKVGIDAPGRARRKDIPGAGPRTSKCPPNPIPG